MASVVRYLSKAARPFHADRKRFGTPAKQALVAGESRVIYVGNLSFYTTEDQIYALFSKCGAIERVIMGLNRVTKTPCGFCFVMYVVFLNLWRYPAHWTFPLCQVCTQTGRCECGHFPERHQA